MSGYLHEDAAAEAAAALNERALIDHQRTREVYDPSTRYTHCQDETCGEPMHPDRSATGARLCVECQTRVEKARARLR